MSHFASVNFASEVILSEVSVMESSAYVILNVFCPITMSRIHFEFSFMNVVNGGYNYILFFLAFMPHPMVFGLIPGSLLRKHSWQCLRDAVMCWGLNLIQPPKCFCVFPMFAFL